MDGHRLRLKAARDKRLEFISVTTERLVERMNVAADAANSKILLNPMKSPVVVRSSNGVTTAVLEFHGRLGIGGSGQSVEARRWSAAATDAGQRALETGLQSVDAARRLGSGTLDRARSAKGSISSRVADRARRKASDEQESSDGGRGDV